jgi:hypothetical protein
LFGWPHFLFVLFLVVIEQQANLIEQQGNLTAKPLLQDGLVEVIEAKVFNFGIAKNSGTFEITEFHEFF